MKFIFTWILCVTIIAAFLYLFMSFIMLNIFWIVNADPLTRGAYALMSIIVGSVATSFSN